MSSEAFLCEIKYQEDDEHNGDVKRVTPAFIHRKEHSNITVQNSDYSLGSRVLESDNPSVCIQHACNNKTNVKMSASGILRVER